jgi:hypothetical protein
MEISSFTCHLHSSVWWLVLAASWNFSLAIDEKYVCSLHVVFLGGLVWASSQCGSCVPKAGFPGDQGKIVMTFL